MATSLASFEAGAEGRRETIYNLIPKPFIVPPKPKMYRSLRLRALNQIPPTASTFGCFGGSHVLGNGKVTKQKYALFGPPLRPLQAEAKTTTMTAVRESVCFHGCMSVHIYIHLHTCPFILLLFLLSVLTHIWPKRKFHLIFISPQTICSACVVSAYTQKFLKCGEKKQRVPSRMPMTATATTFQYPDSASRKPPVPKQEDITKEMLLLLQNTRTCAAAEEQGWQDGGQKKEKDFIYTNAMEVIDSVCTSLLYPAFVGGQ